MAIYIPKPEPIEVYQWFKNGDMPGDGVINNINAGEVVGRHSTYNHFTGAQECPNCSRPIGVHGLLMKPLEPKPVNKGPLRNSVYELCRVVCPGNWVRFHRDEKKRIIGYTLITDEVLRERYVDLAIIPQPKPEKQK